MVRSTSRRGYTNSPIETLPLGALSMRALTAILEKHSAYQSALDDHAVAERQRLRRNQDEKTAATNELPSVQQQVAQLSRRIAEITAQLRTYKVSILGKVLGDSGIEFNGRLYRPDAMPLIQVSKTTYEQYSVVSG